MLFANIGPGSKMSFPVFYQLFLKRQTVITPKELKACVKLYILLALANGSQMDTHAARMITVVRLECHSGVIWH